MTIKDRIYWHFSEEKKKMDQLILAVIWLIIAVGIIGAYAMSLSKMKALTTSKNGIDYRKFFHPGVINIIGYSFTGFLWGLELRRLFGVEGPVLNINLNWREDPVNCTITTIEFLVVWILFGYLVL